MRAALLLLCTGSALAFRRPAGFTPRTRALRPLSFAPDSLVAAGQELAAPAVLVSSGSLLLGAARGEPRDDADRGAAGGGEIGAAGGGEIDVYRDTPLRYLGYTNELGEALGPLVPLPWFVASTYVVAIGYVLADTLDKGSRALSGEKYSSNVVSCALIESADAGIWQVAASVALPGFSIHQIVAATAEVERAFGVEPEGVAALLPSAIGLLVIPLIAKPLDELAEKLMDWTLRRAWSPFLESCSVDYS